IPLAFHPDNTPLQHISKTTGFDDIKTIAVSRLMLDKIPPIKAYWIMMTPRIAQIALRFGADDIDGTVVQEKIYHDAGATTSQSLRRGELLSLIRKAARGPRRERVPPPCQVVDLDSKGGPGACGTRHAVPSGNAHGINVYSSRV